ncbi:unnamed protein product [Bemisia tabaci]|uniref:ABC transporter domain-containing protein n=1 Tax=Bemisia tabaci TaxID=7038 RepID=A0A9P0AB79_BEMTA|nr:PREDICTED: ATP-binding cassette sub-family G member 1-like isoform X1 [Bemisia tabaci]CAH0389477.1 unnamed protein product [Bemisia tabaci]
MSITLTETKVNGETPKEPMEFFLGSANNNKPNFPKRPEIDVSFRDVSYSVVTSWQSALKPAKKTILHGISGEFRAGELTAIMGPSGAGKSTLLNVLAGYKIKGSQGSVMYNGRLRTPENMEHFLRLSCYIQQDDYLRPRLTVQESMMIAAHLKLGINVSYEQKMYQVIELLEILGLTNHANTKTKCLSGGQKKRLSVALELITNPPIIFLDEPTSGLDSTSCLQCVRLLKELSRQGRTIICTIHQPTALLFEKFDHLYGVANGECIYQGSTKDLVTYFSKLDLRCPPYHNPADFLIDVGMGEYGADHRALVQSASSQYRSERADEIITSQDDDPSTSHTKKRKEKGLRMTVLRKHQQKTTDVLEFCKKQPSPPPLWAQTYRLLCRNIITLRRNTVQFGLRMLAHLFISFVFGYLYYDAGSKADSVLGNYVFLYGTTLFLVYTGHMAVLLSFPLEMGVLKHEYINRWYSLGPYMIATILVELPFQVLCCLIYNVPAYYCTGQPLELHRFISFVVYSTVTSLTAQSVGFLYGAILPITIAVFLGPVTIVLMSVFGFAIRLKDIPFYFVWMHHFSFVRAGFQSLVFSIYGYDREQLPCETKYCHFKYPVKFLTEMDFAEIDPIPQLVYICVFCFCVYFLTAFVIWRRLNCR